jgi:pimeloyl-ACP methyl ester carboxylesterase
VRLVRIPDAGHAPWLDEPAKAAEAIEAALAAAP